VRIIRVVAEYFDLAAVIAGQAVKGANNVADAERVSKTTPKMALYITLTTHYLLVMHSYLL